ncbi:MAG TPA: ABC transporter substrate-binding protein [Acidobacteriaceae bacterium]|jgi:iron complex transport system substrate-binding protein|nr:ABC transporter substrate-binding protein [Acidobacteriaceae bacterium]
MRIASLQPSISVTLKHLGKLDQLCACTKYCLDVVPELAALNIPILHDSWTAGTEEILAAKPDLVIASVPYRMESLAAILRSGLPVLALAPHTLNDIYSDTRILASLVHATEAGETIIRQMEAAIAHVRETAAKLPNKKIYCEEWGKPLIHSQGWVAELIEAAGGTFLGTPGAHTDAETIAAADPDVLLFAWCGAGDRVPLERLIEQRSWQHLRAVRSGKVFCIPDEYLNTPSFTLTAGLACIAHALHPQIFPPHPRLIRLG